MGLLSKVKEERKKLKEGKKQYKEIEKSGGVPITTGIGKYLGGHPNLLNSFEGIIIVKKNGIFIEESFSPVNYLHIPIEKIISAEFKTDKEISKDVTLTRLLTIGVFALAFKKKRVEETNYLILTYDEEGIENKIIFESKKAGNLASAILKAKKEHINN